MKNSYECIVVGGGVAGATAAWHLAQLGYEVAVLERTQGPHHKVCGEFLSFEALDGLREMGVDFEGAPVIKYFRLCSPASRVDFTFPFPGRGISRHKLDEDILDKARQAGARVLRGVCMRNKHKSHDGLWKIETNTRDFYARHVFMATGKHDPSPDSRRQGTGGSYLGLKAHLHLRPPHGEFKETTVLFSFPGGYAGICPVENDTMNFCFLIEKARYKALGGSLQAAVSFLRRSNPYLDTVLEGAGYKTPACAVGHIPYGFLRKQSGQDGVYYLGDQMTVIPSFTGDGMACALNTAKNCVYNFDSLKKGLPVDGGLMYKVLKRQMRWAFWAQTFLQYPWLIEAGASNSGVSRFLIQRFFEKTRISKTGDIFYGEGSPVLENNHSGR
jgi:flavin-dependent dehydrogenase